MLCVNLQEYLCKPICLIIIPDVYMNRQRKWSITTQKYNSVDYIIPGFC